MQSEKNCTWGESSSKISVRAGKGRRLICVAGGIVSESKVMAGKLCSRAENGEETLWRMTASPPKLS